MKSFAVYCTIVTTFESYTYMLTSANFDLKIFFQTYWPISNYTNIVIHCYVLDFARKEGFWENIVYYLLSWLYRIFLKFVHIFRG